MKRNLLFILFSAVILFSAYAVPAFPKPYTFTQADGSTITVTLHGDEFNHSYLTDDGLTIARKDDGNFYYSTSPSTISNVIAHNSASRGSIEKSYLKTNAENLTFKSFLSSSEQKSNYSSRLKSIKSAIAKSAVVTTGSPKIPVILVQYSDVKFRDADPVATFNDKINTSAKSAKQYFKDQSYGKFDPDLKILGPVTLCNNRKYYGANNEYGKDQRPGEMVAEACSLISSSVDLSQFDNDHDGTVDMVYVIYAGEGEATFGGKDTIWPHQWYLSTALGSAPVFNGITVDRYACNNEITNDDISGIGCFCHEFSHCLGLMDLYDTHSDQLYGMGSWSIMSYGNYNDSSNTPCGYCAFERESVGWLNINNTENKKTYTIRPLDEGGEAYKVQSPYNINEYYILENRQQQNWDKYNKAHGLMIMHIDYDQLAWDSNCINATELQRCTIIPADNVLNQVTESGDLYPNGGKNTVLTDFSIPAATLHKGSYMGQPITNITEYDGLVSFTFNAIAPPQDLEATEITKNSFKANWSADDDAISYTLLLRKVDDKAPVILISEDLSDMTQKSSDISSSLDNYMANKGWTGSKLYGENGAVRLGNSSGIGILKSPAFDASDNYITVAITAKAYSSDSNVKLTAKLNVSTSKSINLTSDYDTQYITFDKATEASKISFSTSALNKRVLISKIVISTGDCTSTDTSIEKDYDIVIKNITNNSYTFENLYEGATYNYAVKNVYSSCDSKFSDFATVTLKDSGETSVETVTSNIISIDENKVTVNSEAISGSIYTIDGISIAPESHNKWTLNPGIYIIKAGDSVKKVIIK